LIGQRICARTKVSGVELQLIGPTHQSQLLATQDVGGVVSEDDVEEVEWVVESDVEVQAEWAGAAAAVAQLPRHEPMEKGLLLSLLQDPCWLRCGCTWHFTSLFRQPGATFHYARVKAPR